MAADSSGQHGDLLGRPTVYVSRYDSSLIQPISRQLSRQTLGLQADPLPFHGADLWTAYELSWLNPQGKPQVAIASVVIESDSVAIIESKSFKLYLNSFNQTRFSSPDEVCSRLERDLAAAAQGGVRVDLHEPESAMLGCRAGFQGECLDNLEIETDCYQPDAGLLKLENAELEVTESLYSHLLKSNCPVTGQPDWASVLIHYRGPKIDRAALLRYIISFREHQDFHEHCVERMFLDIKRRCLPSGLTVYARYTRRGGLDINPFRSDMDAAPESIRLLRQ